jgi:hypothetical protein
MPDRSSDDQGARRTGDSTGAGAEATRGTGGAPAKDGEKHRSSYGGNAGEPKRANEPKPDDESKRGDEPKDVPTSRR